MTERAISELVSFVLIFGIIITAASLTLVVGQDNLRTAFQVEQTQNTERAMILFGRNVNDVAFSRSPTRTSALRLSDAQLSVRRDTSIRIRVHTPSGGTVMDTTNTTGRVVYQVQDRTLWYENGMVIRQTGAGAVGLTDPSLICTDDTAIVSLVTLQGNTDRQLGSGTVAVRSSLNDTKLLYPFNRSGTHTALDADSVTITVDSQNDSPWTSYLEDHPQWSDTASGFRCTVGANGKVQVRQSVVNVSLQR